MFKKSVPKLLLAIATCQGAGLIGSIFTFSAIPNWYQTLQKPLFSPPNFVFGPVWTILYTLMGIALYLVWKNKNKNKETALIFFGFQLFFNAIWSIIFFGLKNPGLALIDIIILWILIVATIFKFWTINKTAGALLLPYLVWVSFASYLNFSIWILNR